MKKTQDISNDFAYISKFMHSSGEDVVLDVEMCEDSTLRFDTLSRSGDNLTYASRCYALTKNGLFDLFDDFCNGRIRFFSSGKNVQAFLIALYLTEVSFFKKHGMDFVDYYGLIHDEVVDTVNKISNTCDDAMSSKISDGYGISNESKMSYDTKQHLLDGDGYLSESVNTIMTNFEKMKDNIAHNQFCRICIGYGNGTYKMMMDDTVGLPIIFHDKLFMAMFLYNMTELFTFGGFMPMNSKNVIHVDSWKIDSNTPIGEIVSICNCDGNLKDAYSRENFAKRDFVCAEPEIINLDKIVFDENSFPASII